MRQHQVPVLINYVHCTTQTVQSNCGIFSHYVVYLQAVPVSATRSAHLLARLFGHMSHEDKGGACKSTIRRVMCKPYLPHVCFMFLHSHIACVHILF